MRTQEFISKQVKRIENGEKLKKGVARCASVISDDDTIYSYGSHYALLKQIETPTGRTLWVCNNRGYSATTRKHISYANYYADISTSVYKITYVETLTGVRKKIQELLEEMNTKKRKDTQVFEDLSNQLERNNKFLELLKN